jgi:hypothetical protein
MVFVGVCVGMSLAVGLFVDHRHIATVAYWVHVWLSWMNFLVCAVVSQYANGETNLNSQRSENDGIREQVFWLWILGVLANVRWSTQANCLFIFRLAQTVIGGPGMLFSKLALELPDPFSPSGHLRHSSVRGLYYSALYFGWLPLMRLLAGTWVPPGMCWPELREFCLIAAYGFWSIACSLLIVSIFELNIIWNLCFLSFLIRDEGSKRHPARHMARFFCILNVITGLVILALAQESLFFAWLLHLFWISLET